MIGRRCQIFFGTQHKDPCQVTYYYDYCLYSAYFLFLTKRTVAVASKANIGSVSPTAKAVLSS